MIQEELRIQTTTAHQKLEKLVTLRLKAIRGHEDYAALLKIFYAYFNRLEEVISPYISEEVLPDYPQRRHANSLANDILCLGITPSGLPEVTVPPIDSLAKALGALYVMEGSVMGGKIIIQMLARQGLSVGISFFSGYGPDTAAKWASFSSVLGLHIHDDNAREAIGSANQTFENFANVFLSQN